MIKRYDKNVLKKNMLLKLVIGLFIITASSIGFILIENIEAFNKFYIQIILICIFLISVFILVLIAKDGRKLDVEKNYEQIEKYILECHSYISMLYKMHLNNELINKLAEQNIELFSNYPITYEDEYVIEIIYNNKKLIIEFYEEKVMYVILKIDKHDYDIETVKWNELTNINFNNEEEIIDFIVAKNMELL